jgi:3-hydroxyacyl-CoA dehydrogenase
MNALGGEVIEGINKAIDMAEKSYRGLVIANNGQNFSAGANLAMIFMYAIDQEYDELDFMVRGFQKTMMRVRYSNIPVVVAPHSMALGGGCELVMHADKVVASAETYIGLVEVGVGLIPAGGGTKELTLRASDSYRNGDVKLNRLQDAYINIATAKVATSAHEALNMGILKNSDIILVNGDRRIAEAKKEAIRLAELGYVAPIQRTDITVFGKTVLGPLYSGSYGFHFGGYASEHDMKIANKIAYVMAGGDLSAPESKVSEQYLLDLEREAFLSLLGEKKTLERIQSILTKGKPLRN